MRHFWWETLDTFERVRLLSVSSRNSRGFRENLRRFLLAVRLLCRLCENSAKLSKKSTFFGETTSFFVKVSRFSQFLGVFSRFKGFFASPLEDFDLERCKFVEFRVELLWSAQNFRYFSKKYAKITFVLGLPRTKSRERAVIQGVSVDFLEFVGKSLLKSLVFLDNFDFLCRLAEIGRFLASFALFLK